MDHVSLICTHIKKRVDLSPVRAISTYGQVQKNGPERDIGEKNKYVCTSLFFALGIMQYFVWIYESKQRSNEPTHPS